MSAMVNSFANLGIKAKAIDPLGYFGLTKPLEGLFMGRPTPGRKYYGEGPLGPPGPPTQDTAANAAQQNANLMRLRRGVYGNIFGGASGGVPSTATKSQLGS